MSFYKASDKIFGDKSLLIAATAVISVGNMVAITLATGYCSQATAATGLKITGVALKGDGNARGNLNSNGDIDNSAGADGAFNVVVATSYPKQGGRKGFWMQNDAGGGAVAQVDVGSVCYALDGTHVTMTSSGHSKAGTIYEFDSVQNLVLVVFDQ